MRNKIYLALGLLLAISNVAIAKPIDGLTYTTKTTAKQQMAHILQLDPTKLTISVAKANPTGIKLETINSIATKHDAIAAINGGFFHTNGQPAGILKTNDRFYGIAYLPRAAIGWHKHSADANNNQPALIDRLQTKTKLFINNHEFPIHAMNRPLSAKRAILSANTFHGHTAPGNQATNIIIVDDKVTAITHDDPINLPGNCYIYSFGNNLPTKLPEVNVGDLAQIKITVLPQLAPENSAQWENMDFIVGGAPLLIYNGQIIYNFEIEKLNREFTNHRHARTAIGILADQTWVMVVVEDNALVHRPGMTLEELAEFMHSLGAIYALNLDGGGSSTMYLQDKIISHATGDSDEDDDFGGIMRPIADAILVAAP